MIPKDIIIRLISSLDDFYIFITNVKVHDPGYVGIDIETTGLNPYKDSICGISFYCPEINTAVYIPIMDYKLEALEKIVFGIQEIIDSNIMVFHGGSFDIQFLTKLGLKFKEVRDTLVFANQLQYFNLGLKDLVLEFGLVEFSKVRTYLSIIKEVFGLDDFTLKALSGKNDLELGEKYSFSSIDLIKFPQAVEYACNDSIWTVALYYEMKKKLLGRVLKSPEV